jgi:hypothetical protein
MEPDDAAAPAPTGGEGADDTAEWLKEIRELCEVSMDAEVCTPFPSILPTSVTYSDNTLELAQII